MSIPSPSSTPTEQRLLAAIVFSDVAGFSTRVETAEASTLALLEKDFLTMRLFSSMHSGTVIKSTGDGLLMYFTSAVQAVEWALKTQRHFADQAVESGNTDALKHRIGIHVGEIIMRGGDVMGDGVNVAARVQTEARAGGICISQVVYGVVKNKLKLDVIRLEPRKLKNIAEAVQMYHVLLEAPAAKTVPPMAPKVAVVPEKKTAAPVRTIVLAAAGVLLAAAVVVFLVRARQEHEQELAGSRQTLQALDQALRTEPPKPVAADTAVTGPTDSTVIPKTATVAAAPEIDFIKLTTVQPASNATPAEQAMLLKARESLRPLEAWAPAELSRYTKAKPLLVRSLGASPQTWTVFVDANRSLNFAEGGAMRKREWADLKPDVQGAIYASLFVNANAPLTREVVRGAEAFAYINGLPELAEKLVR